MKFLSTLVAIAAMGHAVVASTWFTKAAYNNWHETELERWLSDHEIPYPTPADRRDLEKLVKENWDDYIVTPYSKWDAATLSEYLRKKGVETKKDAEASTDSLLSQVRINWYETEDKAQSAWGSVKDWILDTWTESQLKAFCDKNGIPVPQPYTRDTLLQKARANYEAISQKAGEAAAYPGDWLYSTWTESDLKEWLDANGIPAPQPTTRDKLIASVRRNSRLAYLRMQDQIASASASAQAAYQTVSDAVIDTWSESQLKEFCDKNSIKVPQGSKANELRALVRKHRAQFVGDTVSASLVSAFGAATTAASNEYAKASDNAQLTYQDAFNNAVDKWSESRLKAYLDARGVPVPHASKADELRALVRKHHHRAAEKWNSMDFAEFSLEDLRNYLAATGDKTAKRIAEKADATRKDLVMAAQSAYSSASSAGGTQYASATSYIAKATATANKRAFDTWSESELKAYLDSYGVPVPQGSNINELRAFARRQATYFRYGTSTPAETFLAKINEGAQNTWNWVKDQLNIGADAAKKAGEASSKVRDEL